MNNKRSILAMAFTVLLVGCGGSGSSSSGPQTGTLSLGLTDAPVDDVIGLHLYITGATAKRQGSSPESLPIDLSNCEAMPGETPDCNPVDLLTLQDGLILSVLADHEMLAGEYQWLRLEIDSSQSYVVEGTGGINEDIIVRVPSERGLQLSGGFTILANQTTNLVMDWDARQGLAHSIGTDSYIVKPSIRLVDLAQYGSIEGTVSDTITSGDCPEGGVVYVFEGDVTPDDIDNNDPNPLVTASVGPADAGAFGYQVHYLPSNGDDGKTYTVALTCEATSDFIPTTEELDDSDDDISFIGAQTIVVMDGQTNTINF